MTLKIEQDEVLRMAREAGFVVTIHGESNGYTTLEIRFNPDKLGDYTHPVRTKDLTDDEAQKLWNDTSSIVPMWAHHLHFARAVIAADREKNK